ncbi:MAG: proline--tRNA ligase, partial [Lentisphaerae bacterium]|nr:proline--tRNA ligase [Lentisphaerota bacterium]
MLMTSLTGRRFKEKPVEATLESHAFLLRGGYVRQVANGIYSLLHPAVRVVRKIEQIIREEMNLVDGQEVIMPVALPKELWEESGRYESVGAELIRFVDRAGHDMLLAMTHEEAVVHLVRNEASSYRQYPFMLYQFQTKFRDEPRSRGGLIRVREFTMKDAYSFHTSQEDLSRYYSKCSDAYRRIFARLGIPEVVVVESDSGMMGGQRADEFMLLCDAGEDAIASCEACGYLANVEVATGTIPCDSADPLPLEEVSTPGKKTIEEVAAFLAIPAKQTVKAVFFAPDSEGRLTLALIRGDREINEAKLAKLLKAQPAFADDNAILAAGAVPGFASPINLKNTRIIADLTVRDSANLVTGANKEDFHIKNFNLLRDAPDAEIADISKTCAGDGCPECGASLLLKRGVEVGNIFQLGTKYSGSMKMRYLDEAGSEKTPIMGCYGIGVGRLVSSIMEVRRDKFGPIWPLTVAPWQVHICTINFDKPDIRSAAEQLYKDLTAADVEVIMDDRNERPGVQFAEADLL